MKLYKPSEIIELIPQLKNLSFYYWVKLKAQAAPYKTRIVKNIKTDFYTPYAIPKIKNYLRKHRPELFRKKSPEVAHD